MALLATLTVFAVLCTSTVDAAKSNGEGQRNGCSRDDARKFYERCRNIPQPTPVGIKDAKGRPVSLYSDMTGPIFSQYMMEMCTLRTQAINKCFQEFFNTPEGKQCVDPEPLTIELQNTGGFCGPEGLSPWADTLVQGVLSWDNKCFESYNQRYFLMRQCQPNRRNWGESSAEMTAAMECVIRGVSVGKMEECTRSAYLSYVFYLIASTAPFGVAPDAAAISQAISTLPP